MRMPVRGRTAGGVGHLAVQCITLTHLGPLPAHQRMQFAALWPVLPPPLPPPSSSPPLVPRPRPPQPFLPPPAPTRTRKPSALRQHGHTRPAI